MEDHSLTPEQEANIAALSREFERQLARVDVDLHVAAPRLRELWPEVERQISPTESAVTLTVDFSGLLATLRDMPDGAGTDAFVAAYIARH